MTVALRIMVAILLLAVIWHFAGGENALARLADADPLWLVVAFVALHAQTILSALRWRLVSTALGLPMATGHAVREYYMAQIVNQTLPGGVAGDAVRAVRAAPTDALQAAVMAVVFERAAGQIALMVVLCAGLAFSMTFGDIFWPPGMLPVLVAAILTVVAMAGLVLARSRVLRQQTRTVLAMPGHLPRQLGLSACIVALNLGAFAATAHATKTALSAEAIVTLIPLILIAMLIPLSIAGWGWREGAAAALFPLAGATPDAGLVASATYGALVLAAAVPGAALLTRPALRPPA